MSLINSISNTYKGNQEFYEEVTKEMSVEEKSRELEEVLTGIVDTIAYVNYLTENKNVDVELLLQIVASYVIGIEQGELDPEDTPPPSKLFEESLFPSLENVTTDVEVVKEDTDASEEQLPNGGAGSGTTEEVGSKSDSN